MNDEWWNVPHWKYTPWGYVTFNKPRTRTQYAVQSIVGGILPPIGAYHRYRDDMAYMDDYLGSRGFDYDYIRYPSRTAGYSGGNSLGSAIRGISNNVTSLYSDRERQRRGRYQAFKNGMYYQSWLNSRN